MRLRCWIISLLRHVYFWFTKWWVRYSCYNYCSPPSIGKVKTFGDFAATNSEKYGTIRVVCNLHIKLCHCLKKPFIQSICFIQNITGSALFLTLTNSCLFLGSIIACLISIIESQILLRFPRECYKQNMTREYNVLR